MRETIATRVLAMVGEAMAPLTKRRSELQRELQRVNAEINEVRVKVHSAIGEQLAVVRTTPVKAQPAKRVVSAATRRKMSIAARRRHARERKQA